MEFTKMNGLGNDFIVIYGEHSLPDHASTLARKLCNRHFGIGADGLVYILPSAEADGMMRIFNSDGTEAEQCGNAIRCVAKYLYDHGYVSYTDLRVETVGAGIQQLQLTVENGITKSVRVDMGVPLQYTVDQLIEINGHDFQYTAVSMGNPHCVIYVEDVHRFDVATWGSRIEHHPNFPNKVNVEFATIRSRQQIDMRVWERGAGVTLACGSGACATLVASVLNGKTDRKAVLSLQGGDLFIEWNEANDHVYMTGPAETVYTGKITSIADLSITPR